MKVVYLDKEIGNCERSVCCIGYFDALHRGHQQLINEAIRIARANNVLSGLICFSPDPVEVITGRKQPHAAGFDSRIKLMESFGLDIVYIMKFDEDFMKSTPKEFCDNYVNKMNLHTLVCGFDYSFGYKGMGKSHMLKELGNFDVSIIEEFKYYGKKISSTRIRNAILSGRFSLVNKLLGWNYYLNVTVDKVNRVDGKWLYSVHCTDEDIITPKKYLSDDLMIDKEMITYSSDTEYKVKDTFNIYL